MVMCEKAKMRGYKTMRLSSNDDAEKLRDVLLLMVYLDEWRLYRPRFPVEKMREGVFACKRLSQLLEWIRREGAAYTN